MRRLVTPEFMDDPNAEREELALALRYLRRLNARMGGVSALIGRLQAWSARWPRDRPITLLDIGTGSADIPLAARAWAARRGFDLRVTGLDLHATTVALAREHVADAEGVIVVQGNALALGGMFEAGSFDYVHAGLFLHHLKEIEVLTALAAMDRVARAGIVWNDLYR